jgi:hypothetical protein
MSETTKYPYCRFCQIQHDAESWAKLPAARGGLRVTYTAEDLGSDKDETNEYRNCMCNSTMSILVDPEDS